jgi:cytosine/adenosine deaminase-related metal-dependent hydrolase
VSKQAEIMVPATDSIEATWSLSARWIFPVSGPPVSDGLVSIVGDKILAVESRGRRTADRDLGDVAILPGFVNAHTHLDLSALRGKCPPSADFTSWLRKVIAYRRSIAPQETAPDVRSGLSESLRLGTTLLGDIAATGASWQILADAPLRSVVFYELLGLTKPRATLAYENALAWISAHSTTEDCRPGLSPHAPYSAHLSLMADTPILALRYRCPLAIHLAESREELELLQERRGPFVPFLQELDVWEPTGLVRRPEELLFLADVGVPTLFIHCNYLLPPERLPNNATIVYCPRTHSAFGHEPHPFRSFLARGIRVALGTDSLASNPDLSILSEMRHLHRHYPDVPGDVLLRMATLSGAEALDRASETGSLEAGKSADLVVVPLASGSDQDPHKRVLESHLSVDSVLFRGQWIARPTTEPQLP